MQAKIQKFRIKFLIDLFVNKIFYYCIEHGSTSLRYISKPVQNFIGFLEPFLIIAYSALSGTLLI